MKICCCFIILNLLTCCSVKADEALRKKFLAEYPEAARRLREHYGTLRIVSETTGTHSDGKPVDLPKTNKTVYVANNSYVRIDQEVFGASKRASGFVLGPEGPFIADRKQDAKKYHIRSAETSALGSPKERQSLFTSLSRAAYSPFSSNSSNGPIVELLKDRDFIVEDVSLAREGSELVSVKWKFRPSLPRAVGEWVFDTAKSWALVSHKSRAQLADGKWLPVENIITIEYEGLAGDVPLVKSYESVNKFTETGEIADREYTTVSEIVSSNAGREQFTLASYGLSYGQGVPENRTGKWLVIAGMIGIGSVLMGRWIFRRWRTAV